ncbi:MAG: hypothetical protein MUC97_16920 [Bernardetiaceae bacterium]|nr:hypothetical protein [Bernardetiaceae bacterium]
MRQPREICIDYCGAVLSGVRPRTGSYLTARRRSDESVTGRCTSRAPEPPALLLAL